MREKNIFKTAEHRLLFMSDIHYNHENILRTNHRRFSDIGEMNAYVEKVLRDDIQPGDILFDLGDLFWKTEPGIMKKIISEANPFKFYKLMGNHDKESLYYQPDINRLFADVQDLMEIYVDHLGKTYKLVLSHYPLVSWMDKPRGSFDIHGHTHGNIDDFNNNSPDLRIDISWDGSFCKSHGDSFLISFEDILEKMKEKAGADDFRKYALTYCTEL